MCRDRGGENPDAIVRAIASEQFLRLLRAVVAVPE
jgi:hypothetical protein